MSLDPLVIDTQSPFAYVNNDPMNEVDPDGDVGVHVSIPTSRRLAAGLSVGGSLATVLSNLDIPIPIAVIVTTVVRVVGASAVAVGTEFQGCVNDYSHWIRVHGLRYGTQFSCYIFVSVTIIDVAIPALTWGVTFQRH